MRPKTPRRVGAAGLTRATVFYLGATTAACTGESTPQQAPAPPSISVEVAPSTAPAQESPPPARADIVATLEPSAPPTDEPLQVSPGPALDPSDERRPHHRRERPSPTEAPTSLVLAPATGYGGPPMHGPGWQGEDPIRGSVRIDGVEGPRGGHLDSALVDQMFRRRLAAVRSCYERELRRDPTVSGRVTVEFTVAPSGTVTAASAHDDTLHSAAVTACITQAVRRFRFAPSPEDDPSTFRARLELSQQD